MTAAGQVDLKFSAQRSKAYLAPCHLDPQNPRPPDGAPSKRVSGDNTVATDWELYMFGSWLPQGRRRAENANRGIPSQQPIE